MMQLRVLHIFAPSLKATVILNESLSKHKPNDVDDRKLFVGMLNKKYNEQDVRQLFSSQGSIEECTVLRDQNGQSKGCAFVTYATKQSAISAIKVLHQSQTMEGCSAPLVVKFADTQREKEQKKIQQLQSTILNVSNSGIPTSIGQSATTISSPLMTNPPQHPNPFIGADAITPSSLQLLQLVGLQQQQLMQGLSGVQTDTTSVAAANGMLAPFSVQNLLTMAALGQPQLGASNQQISAQLTNAAAPTSLWTVPDTLPSAYTTAALPQYAGGLYSPTPLTNNNLTATASIVAGKQIEGPDGGNLFIYHLPQEFTDTDLASTFLPFGNVVSAKVFIDKQTNLSKCFGFVSYDNSQSAQAAIQAMHGFQIGAKRLKVQLKRSKDASKPY
ncbi:hypothetical protein HA402_001597 [Bradysia odoriphaga]|nr:hypothetical protein HA402_001597 [Bradysia odoriphaga]